MAEHPAAAPAGVAASERDVLLATKLHVPRPQPGFVPRPRLVEALDAGMERGLILVCAPAGFGKTGLQADWVRRAGHPVAWLSLDAGDNDPARFWRHVVAALDWALPGTSERIGPLLGPPAPLSFEALVTVLINELAARPGEGKLLLVLDDYHQIDTQQVHDSLVFLLEHLPPGVHLVLASRSDPPLPLARLRAAGQLAELRAGDLRFTAEEAAALLREAIGADLPDAAAAALAARTEGWAAGLQLAALSLRGQPDATGFVAAFSGSHRYVLDYLAEEVLEHQSEQVHEFLLDTSVLDRLSGELCDAVTGRTDSQAMLEQVERAGLFLVPLDEVREWWRYHHLFADLLRARLQMERPGRAEALHRAAAAWSDEHDLADEAVRHALAAEDSGWAARLIERHFDALLLRGEAVTLRRWLATLPTELVRPRLLVALAWMALASGDVEAAQGLLYEAEHAQPGSDDEPFEPSIGKAASLLVNVPARMNLVRANLAEICGDADSAAAFASRGLAEIDEEERLLASVARLHLAMAQVLDGRLPDAEREMSSAAAQWQVTGQLYLAGWGCHYLGQVQRALGRLDAAERTYQQTLEITAPPGRAALPAAGAAHMGLAEVAYQRNQLEDALRHITEGIDLCRRTAWTAPVIFHQPLANGLATLAWIRQTHGDTASALEAISEAERAAPRPGVAGVVNPVPAQRARLMLTQGDVDAAARWTQQAGLKPDDEPGYPREPEYLVLARVLLAQDRPGPALVLLERLHAAAAGQDRTGSMIEIGALQALALAASGDETAAVDTLAQALTLACPQGHVRVFADEGPPMAALLARLVAAQRADHAAARNVPLGCLARVLQAAGAAPAAPGARRTAAAVPGLVEQLTAREGEVLVLLAAGMPNPRIAEELVVSLDTVKKHVSHLLGKLGAANRTEAVNRARQLGLIP